MKKSLLTAAFINGLLLFSFSQNVGVGTTTPQSKLHVKGTGGGTQIIIEENAGSMLRISNEANAAGPYIGTTSNHSFSMVSNNTVRMVVAANGNVGIGQSNPQQKLDLNGAIRIGTTTTEVAGTIRYNNNKFEGHNGTEWKDFEQFPLGSLIASPTVENTALESAGYNFIGGVPNVITRKPASLNIAANTWLPAGKLAFAMIGVTGQTAVLGNNKMYIWGGADRDYISNGAPYTQTFQYGASYDPVSNFWDSISMVAAPSARMQHTAVWTGQDMLIWGGRTSNNDGTFTANDDGGAWKPISNSWSGIGAPGIAARYNHTAVWSGSEMIVWGGQLNNTTALNTGARWNGSNWTGMSNTNAPVARTGHTAIWTGTVMIVWGGSDAQGGITYNTGSVYTPGTNTWASISTTNAPTARSGHSAVWTGTEMIIWGGGSVGAATNTGARYNPLTNTWSSVNIVNSPLARRHHAAVWTGSEMIIFGGNNLGDLSGGARYNPLTNNWNPMIELGSLYDGAVFSKMSAVWTGQQAVFFGGTNSNGSVSSNICLRYFPQAQVLNTFTESNNSIWLYQKQ